MRSMPEDDQRPTAIRDSIWGLPGLLLLVLVVLMTACASTTPTRSGQTFRDCSDCPEMVVVTLPAGALGSGTGAVTVAVGRYEITRDEFDVYAKETVAPDFFCMFPLRAYLDDRRDYTRHHPGLGSYHPSGRDPAICVSWFEAEDYVEWLSRKTGQQYRLPTDPELQYLVNGDAKTPFPWGDRSEDACRYGNVLDQSARSQNWVMAGDVAFQWSNCTDGFAYTAPVGSFKPNAFGLYDTIGNVSEWTATCATDKTLSPAQGHDCARYMLRGGSWTDPANRIKRDARGLLVPTEHAETVGFRVMRVLPD